jgi:hypothetical protein
MKVKVTKLWKRLRRERGSALLVSLMVIVGLSMLGLGFVALSETESAISTNQRNREEVLSHAEAAASVVVDWFQNPAWALSKGLQPSNNSTINTELGAMKLTRKNSTASGVYKPISTTILFDLPFKPSFDDRFYGTENYPDILINDTTSPKFLKTFNAALFNDTTDAGRITDIRIYAPPIVGGLLDNATHYWESQGDRYGVATVRVTCSRFDASGNVISQRQVHEVVTEFPFPGPNGPIQSNSAITTNGSFTVYWGQISAQDSITLKTKDNAPGLPWATAWDVVNFEHGYDSTWPWKPNTAYKVGDVVHASKASLANDAKLHDWSFTCTVAGTSNADPLQEPVWDSKAASTCACTPVTTYVDGGTLTWVRTAPRNWPNFSEDGGAGNPTRDYYDWLYQLIGQTYVDPWEEVRTRDVITEFSSAGNNNPEPNGFYNDPTKDPTKLGTSSSFFTWFQNQTTNKAPQYKITPFPNIDYVFWKQMAQAGDGQGSVYYFAYNAGKNGFYRLSDSTTVKSFDSWANALTGTKGALGPGFYFFDTIGGVNPQPLTNKTGVLTPSIKISGGSFCMKGFIYLNATQFGSTGVSGETNKYYAFPAEPFRDVGFHHVDPATGLYVLDSVTGRVKGPTNDNAGKWDCQELNNNGVCDIYVIDITKGGTVNVKRPDGTNLPSPTWMPVEHYEGCNVVDTVAGGALPANPCSEPHEPYLNLIYPRDGSTDAALAPDIGGNVGSYKGSLVQIGWENPASPTRLAKVATDSSSTAVVNCSTNSSNCTSNAYDDSGPLTKIPPKGPILEGVLYNEGDYDSTGNASYYGSILVRGNCCGTGTPAVYFDQSLLTGDFKKKFPSFPRVYVSSYTTEQ